MTPTPTPQHSPCPQRLPFEGAVNFRDLGGYATADGRRVKKGRVFRADHLSRLTAGDHAILTGLHLKLVCDFRTIREQQMAPDHLPADGSIQLVPLPVQAADFDPATVIDRLRSGDAGWLSMEFFVELYRRYLDEFGPVWGEVLRLAAHSENLPLVFHCTGGKDRTGVCAALLLLALGVAEEEVRRDHDLSNRCNAPRLPRLYAEFAALGYGPEQVAPYLQAPAEPLAAMLAHLKRHYGTVEGYLRTKAGLTDATLRALQAELLE